MNRVLIANRGEIAIRIAEAAAGLGMESVSIFPTADERSLHAKSTTSSHRLDGGDPVAAYLDVDAVIAAARATESDCVHPGYGFLSENAHFAEACGAAGITFIGPSPDALTLFGDKVRARALAHSLGVPIVPGAEEPLASAGAAATKAAEIGYPVMLKAAAGGGGRGIRAVDRAEDMTEAFDSCAREAESAFGDGTMFLERLVHRPRHVEVQVLADATGEVIHLFERDCSVQLRNQKVIEVAPAPNLDPELRARLHADAITLVKAARYLNAGTVEFLVSPETGEHYFIECNPRIQVEHTVTEQVMGVDLVEAQFQIAAGATLDSLGLLDVGTPRGYSVQARVVAQGPGTLSAYKEPSGAGVRVDAAGYVGFSPPPQFDPLLAKVICTVTTATSVDSAVDRTRRALGDFHIAGLPTNVAQLQVLLAHPDVRSGDARTTLLRDSPELLTPKPAAPSDALALLEQHVSTNGASVETAEAPLPPLELAEGNVRVDCPVTSNVIEIRVAEGDAVAAGDTLLVVSAMKMETSITAPTAGIVAAVQDLEPEDIVPAGSMLAVIAPSGASGQAPTLDRDNSWVPVLDQVDELKGLADKRLAPDSDEPGVVRQRNRNKLHCRERIAMLLDDGSFREIGSLAGFASYDEDGIAAFTPANHVGGRGKIHDRQAIVCADDFTSRGGHADGAIASKSLHLDLLSVQLGVPSIRLLDGSSGGGSVAAMVPQQKKEGDSAAKESRGAIKAGRPRVSGGGGSFLPGHLGSTEYTEQLSSVPVVNMLLGSVVGIGAAKAVLGHFAVMVRDIAQLFVAGPPVVSHAMGYEITKEDLGDWRIHCRNGSVDNLAESEEDAAGQVRRFLSYLPSNVKSLPPVLAPAADDPPDRREEELLTLIPRKRTTTFDVRRAIELMADRDSFFEIGPLWGTDQVTGFVRFNGHPLGVIASDSRHVNGGALTADGCSKLTRHLDLCDLFNIPVLNLCDNPGFAVGLEHEIAGTIRRGAEWMIAFAQVQVPIFTVLMRRSFGVAGNNYATPRRQPSVRVTWPAADVGGIPPEGGIEAAYKRQLAEAQDPVALRAELEARIEGARGPVGPLNKFQIEEMIDPRDTREMICDWVETAYARLSPGARPIQFRP